MIWGGTSRKGQTSFHIYRLDEKETVTFEAYVKCLKKHLLSPMDSKFGFNKWRLLQDNARLHTTNNTREYLEEENIKIINHPP